MTATPGTQVSLLIRLRDTRDGAAWSRFVDVYGPLVYGFLKRRGLQEADVADLTQDVLRQVLQAVKSLDYDRSRGSFRSWLFTVVQNRLTNFLQREQGTDRARGGSDAWATVNSLVDPAADPAKEWDAEFERRLFEEASRIVQADFSETTWAAFHRTAIEGTAARCVAAELGLTTAAVYLARRRVLTRLKEQIQILGEC